jgi:hypothetical protein
MSLQDTADPNSRLVGELPQAALGVDPTNRCT